MLLNPQANLPRALLQARGADRTPHPGGSLLSHLERTADQLQRWGASDALVRAGLCHAAYGTHAFDQPLLPLGQRELLRETIGDAAEALVYAYCAQDRSFGALDRGALRDRFNGEHWTPSQEMRRELIELSVANELDVLAHAGLTGEEQQPLTEALVAYEPWLSRAASDALRAALSAALRTGSHGSQQPSATGLRSDHAAGLGRAGPVAMLQSSAVRADHAIAFRELGARGPQVVLWHGGAGPELTWVRQHALAAELRLCIPWRRGFAPSRDSARQDWEADARDLLRIAPPRAHVIAHSYGGVSALHAASLAPERFASLTLIEPPLSYVAADEPAVEQLAQLARAFTRGDRSAREAFLRLADLPLDHPETARVERRARDLRDPGEAAPAVAPLLAAGVRVAVVSGAHTSVVELICDRLAAALSAERWVLPGAGHAVQRAPDFNARFTHWIATIERQA